MKDYHTICDDLDYYPSPSDFGYYHKEELPNFDGVKSALRDMFEHLYVNPNDEKAKDNLDYLLDEFMVQVPQRSRP